MKELGHALMILIIVSTIGLQAKPNLAYFPGFGRVCVPIFANARVTPRIGASPVEFTVTVWLSARG
jgi:hypothetical protein